ncbi:unnamed protein product, partial [marine sediment metagenome]
TTVYNTCFNGHEWKRKQIVDMDTGITDCKRCPVCNEPIQSQSIPEFEA